MGRYQNVKPVFWILFQEESKILLRQSKKVIRREILGNTVGENDKMCVAMAELSKIFPAADIRDNI